MATTVEDLSNELLVSIFEYVQNNASKRGVLSWMLCCQRFHNIAIPILYRNISITILKIVKLVGQKNAFQLDQDNTLLHHTRSLTIWLPSLYQITTIDGDRPADLDKCTRLLSKAVEMMPALTTFSLMGSSAYTPNSGGIPVTLSRLGISHVLDALPRTVVNLELDTGYLEFSRWSRKPPRCCQLCEAIRRLLPRLHNLRLRMRFLCADLLMPLDSNPGGRRSIPADEEATAEQYPLRTAIIWLSSGEYEVTAVPCCYRINRRPWPIMRDQLRTDIVTNAQQLYLSGSIPRIQSLVIMEKIGFSNGGAWVKRDVIAHETSAIPVQELEGQSGSPENPGGGYPYLERKHAVRIPREPGGGQGGLEWEEYVGTHEGLLGLIEGEAAWVQATTGSRFPNIIHCRRAMRDPLDLQVEDAATFRQHSQLTYSPCRDGTPWNMEPARWSDMLGRVILTQLHPPSSSAPTAWGFIVKP